jgi:cytochrome c-type biogenesis protein CcmH
MANAWTTWCRWCLLVLACALTVPAISRDAPAASDDPVLESRMLGIAAELRCLVCQNQTIADSHSGLATDLRQEIREQLQKGQTDAQIRDYMTARYGNFILYRPPVDARTALLWFGPGALALIGLFVLWRVLRQRAAMAADAFDPDVLETEERDRS